MSFRVIDGDGPGKDERERERDRIWAKQEFSDAIREAAANMLRIIRGAGKPHDLLLQMKTAIDTAVKFQELHHHWPFDVIANDLQLEDEIETILSQGRKGEIDQARIDRWEEDGRFEKMMAVHTISKGVLQAVASELIGQNMQQRSGESELHQGILDWIRVREERDRKNQEAAKAARSAQAKKKAGKPTKPIVP